MGWLAASHVYQDAGDYNATLTIFDENDRSVFATERFSTAVLGSAVVSYSLVLTDDDGVELPRDNDGRYQVHAGQSFEVEVYVEDRRAVGDAGGVFAAFADVAYEMDVMDWIDGSIDVATEFTLDASGSIDESNGRLEEVGGGTLATRPTGAGVAGLLFRASGRIHGGADDGVLLIIQLDQADDLPRHATLVWGAAAIDQPATYETETLVVTPTRPWRNPENPLDVNDDGQVTLADRLEILNELVANGEHVLDGSTPPPPPYLDVDGNGLVTFQDAAIVTDSLFGSGTLRAAEPDARNLVAGAAVAHWQARVIDVPASPAAGEDTHPPGESSAGDALPRTTLRPVVDAAIARWETAGLDSVVTTNHALTRSLLSPLRDRAVRAGDTPSFHEPTAEDVGAGRSAADLVREIRDLRSPRRGARKTEVFDPATLDHLFASLGELEADL